jgi:hypothetical protein
MKTDIQILCTIIETIIEKDENTVKEINRKYRNLFLCILSKINSYAIINNHEADGTKIIEKMEIILRTFSDLMNALDRKSEKLGGQNERT